MSRWLALAEGGAIDTHTPTDNMTKPDKTPAMQPADAFCRVLSNCQAEEGERPGTLNGDDMRHGFALNGHPKTWTGNIVSLDVWRQLSEWEKHGPDERHWNGLTKSWEAQS